MPASCSIFFRGPAHPDHWSGRPQDYHEHAQPGRENVDRRFQDESSPTYKSGTDGWINLRDAHHLQGWYLAEKHVFLDGIPVS